MPRLFVALTLPEDVKHLAAALQDEGGPVRWTRLAQLHLTLRFIGETEDEAGLIAALRTVQHAPFSLRLKGVGTFPNRRRPRLLWTGVEGDTHALADLQRQVEQAVVHTGSDPESRRYHPHVTVGRFRRPKATWAQRFCERHQAFEAPPFPVTAFHLYQSDLQPSGAVLTQRAHIALAP